MLASRVVLLVIGLVVAACRGDDEGLAVPAWQLAGEAAARPGPVRVPGHLPVRDRAGTYTLRAAVTVPPGWRGTPLTLWIADVTSRVHLAVDGVASASLDDDAGGGRGYRARGPLSWPVPAAASADGVVELVLTVEHRWTQSGWWTSAPRLTPAGVRPSSAARVEWINTYAAIAAACSLIQLGLTSLAIYLVDRHRRTYLWFAIQLVSAAYYPLHVLGVAQGWLGVYDTPLLGIALVSAISASIWFTHSFFELPPPWRGWAWLWAGSALAYVVFADPFVTTPVSGRLTVTVVAVLTCYQLLVCGRLAVRHPDRLTARFQLASWIALSATMPPDLVHWLGLTTLLDGARPTSLGLLSFALCLSLLLSRRHILSLRAEAEHRRSVDAQRAELVRLNDELRRQVQERSSQLFAALALGGGEQRPGLSLATGDVVAGRYRVVRVLGRGGMGTVHEVERLDDGRRFALKLTHDVHGAALARLAREAVIASRVSHANLVGLVDVSVSDGGYLYLVMELVDGVPLAELRPRWGDPAWAVDVLAQIADGLVALHAAGVVHRDLKPANILVREHAGAREVKITDFGVSRPMPWFGSDEGSGSGERARSGEVTGALAAEDPTRSMADRSPAELAAIAREAERLEPEPTADLAGAAPRATALAGGVTRTGMLVGTPPYIAPEMAERGYTPQPSADVFALGVIAFEMFTGERPYTKPAVLARIAGELPLRTASLAARCPPGLAELIDRCLALDPALRPDPAALSRALREEGTLRA